VLQVCWRGSGGPGWKRPAAMMGGAATPRLEVGDGPDGRAPPASDRLQKKKKRGAVLGRRKGGSGPIYLIIYLCP
jgi:hypothetical protein